MQSNAKMHESERKPKEGFIYIPAVSWMLGGPGLAVQVGVAPVIDRPWEGRGPWPREAHTRSRSLCLLGLLCWTRVRSQAVGEPAGFLCRLFGQDTLATPSSFVSGCDLPVAFICACSGCPSLSEALGLLAMPSGFQHTGLGFPQPTQAFS